MWNIIRYFRFVFVDAGIYLHAAPQYHDDAIKWKHFPRDWPFVQGIPWSPLNSPHRSLWRRALMFFICSWINGWVNNPDADFLRRHRAHHDITVMLRVDLKTKRGIAVLSVGKFPKQTCDNESIKCINVWNELKCGNRVWIPLVSRYHISKEEQPAILIATMMSEMKPSVNLTRSKQKQMRCRVTKPTI